ncbi:ABC1 kinase family protein [Microbacterium sp. bgisy203]|uniref:ABC1 kinase family protein n=1 Tax=Microbacterium sp. bgisy203 TaxID=3413799 RepID=UPI003D72F1F4
MSPEIAAMSPGQRLRAAFGELGTAWIKLGQTLSTRPDVVGPEIAAELSGLQSDAPPDASGAALVTVEAELGAPVAKLYGSFHRPAMASASVAEVHKATLKDHTRVVVKVVHHNAAAQVRADLDVMRVVAVWLEQSDADLQRYRIVDLVDDFAAMLADALDLRTEAAHLEAFGRNFSGDPAIVIPHAYEELSGPSVLTMTREEGRSPVDRAAVERAGWDVEELVTTVADAYLEMIFRDGLFHADPHPGNLLLTPDHRIAILDFGDVGRVPASRRAQLARMGVALVVRDDRSLADEILAVTDPPPETDLDAARRDLADWIDGSLYTDVDEMDVPAIADEFAEIMRRHALRVPDDLALLARTLLRLQGLAQSYGAQLDLVGLIAPYALRLAREQLDPMTLVFSTARAVRRWTQLLGDLPDETRQTLQALGAGKIAVEFRFHDEDRVTESLVGGIVAGSSILAAAQLLSRRTPPTIAGISLPGAAALIASGVMWVRRPRVDRPRTGSPVQVAVEALRRRRRA